MDGKTDQSLKRIISAPYMIIAFLLDLNIISYVTSASVSIHVYQSSDNIRNRKNSMKMQHSASILCILWVILITAVHIKKSKKSEKHQANKNYLTLLIAQCIFQILLLDYI